MPKSIVIEPKDVFAKSTIRLSDIPINTYNRTLEQELVNYSTEDFLHIWQDMCAIREFETILNEIKTKGAYKGVAYNHAGPAHLSIGQEAAAVGMAFSLSPEDFIFGSHRSHGEILAKGFSSIRKLTEPQLSNILESYRDGVMLRPVEREYHGSVRELAIRTFVYGAYSEIFARETGFNRGLGGSMHAFFRPRRRALQASEPQAGRCRLQHWRRIIFLRSSLGRHHLLRDGSVLETVGPIAGRRIAHHF
jgi:2-oxoisovalerate dehydrogenase E1 component